MKKKTFLISTILCVITLTNCNNNSSVVPGHKFKRVNFNYLDKGLSIPSNVLFLDDNPYVVYIPIEDYQRYITSFTMGVKRNNNLFTFSNVANDEKAVLNADTGVLSYNSYSRFMTLSDTPHREIYSPSLLGGKLAENESSYKKGNMYSIDLSEYNLKPIKVNSNYYLPLDLLMRIDPYTDRGTAYYDGKEDVTLIYSNIINEYKGEKLNSYPKSFYEYSYNLFSFDVDFVYGLNGYSRPMRHDNNKSFTFNKDGALNTFEKYKNNIVNANNTLEFDVAFDKLFDELEDGGHSVVEGISIATDESKIPESFKKHKERDCLKNALSAEKKARSEASKEQKIGENICGFDTDNDGKEDIGYFCIDVFDLSSITYGLQFILPKANSRFNKKLNPDSKIRDVVIDIANNGGGATTAEGLLLSWICNGKAKQILKDAKDGSVVTTVCQYDINKDGKYDECDYLPNDVNIYILTDATFSAACALSFDTYMYTLSDEYKKDSKNIKFIGKPNFGGACSICKTTLMPTGLSYHMSSNSVGVDWRDYSKTCDEIMPIEEDFKMSVDQIVNRTGYINPKIVSKRK